MPRQTGYQMPGVMRMVEENPRHLLDVLKAARDSAGQLLVFVDESTGQDRVLSVGQLADDASRIAAGLAAAGAKPGAPVIVMAHRPGWILRGFWGAMIAGLIPTILPIERARARAVWDKLDRPLVLAGPDVRVDDEGIQTASRSLTELVEGHEPAQTWREPDGDDVAFYQFSSGSTSSPKGVELTHENVLSNMIQIAAATQTTEEDVVVNWMPYYHDMGLIGGHLTPLWLASPQVKLQPSMIVSRPVEWLRAVDRHRGTVLTSANFALAMVTRRVKDAEVAELDLSCVRTMAVGAEPISVQICEAFVQKLAPARFPPRAIQPAYGLAEASVAVSFGPLYEGLKVRRFDRSKLVERVAVETSLDGAVQLVDLGFPVAGCSVRVVDEEGKEVPEGHAGVLQVRGPNVAARYVNDPEATRQTFVDGWVNTGDIGALIANRICITGRARDEIVLRGRNYPAEDLEQVVAGLRTTPRGRVAVVSWPGEGAESERIVIFITRRGVDIEEAMLSAFRAVARTLDYTNLVVLPIESSDFPRTTSGKLRRVGLQDQLVAGEFDKLVERVEPLFDGLRAELGRVASEGTGQAEDIDAEQGDTLSLVTRIVAGVLEIDEVEPDSSFAAHGGTSLKALDVLEQLEAITEHPIDPALMRLDTTPRMIASYIDEQALRAAQRPPAPATRELAVSGVTSDALSSPELAPTNAEPDSAGDGSNDAETEPRRTLELDVSEPTRQGLAAVRPRSPRPPQSDDVVVVSMACKLPGASSPEQLWELYLSGRTCIGEPPATRRFLGSQSAQTRALRGGWLDDVYHTDPETVGLAPTRAAQIDPRQRLLLELATEALERANMLGLGRNKNVGVFIGAGDSGWSTYLDSNNLLDAGSATAAMRNMLASRLAKELDLFGPALAIDAACASSHYAIYLAAEAISRGECDVAIAGGVHLDLDGSAARSLAAAGAVSPSGQCRPFDVNADGTLPGEGAGVIILARRDATSTPPLAEFVGGAVNSDGRAVSDMAPNPARQSRLFKQIYPELVHPDDVAWVEAHATGTPVGDPVEVRSLSRAFASSPREKRWLGATKGSTGHLLYAAGMPSVLKVLLAFQNRQIPATVGCLTPLDRISSSWSVPTQNIDWDVEAGVDCVAVDGFGFGGTNVHLVFRAPHEDRVSPVDERRALIPVSAGHERALDRFATHLTRHLDQRSEDASDVSNALLIGRPQRAWRAALVSEGSRVHVIAKARSASRPNVALLFPGQGAQTVAMMRALGQRFPSLDAMLREACVAAGEVRARSLYYWATSPEVTVEELAQTDVLQPLLVVVEITLARWLTYLGLRPSVVIGHSVGELSAARVAGIFSDEDVLYLARTRGEQMLSLTDPGAMLAVMSSEAAIVPWLRRFDRVGLAAINAPQRIVLAGPEEQIEALQALLGTRGVQTQRVDVSRAFHSGMMRPAAHALEPVVRGMQTSAATLSMITAADTKTIAAGARIPSSYWSEQITRPVRFSDAIGALPEDVNFIIEVGPGRALANFARQHEQPASRQFHSLLGGADPVTSVLEVLGHLFVAGMSLQNADALLPRQGAAFHALPPTPLIRRELIVEPEPTIEEQIEETVGGLATLVPSTPGPGVFALPRPEHPFLTRIDKLRMDSAELSVFAESSHPLLAGHTVHDVALVPGAVLIDLMLAATQRTHRWVPTSLTDFVIHRPLLCDEDVSAKVTLERTPDGVHAVILQDDHEIASGLIGFGAAPVLPKHELHDFHQLGEDVPTDHLARQLAAHGMTHGAALKRLSVIRATSTRAFGQLSAPPTGSGVGFMIHPALLDAAMQLVAANVLVSGDADSMYVPSRMAKVEVHSVISAPCAAIVEITSKDQARISADVSIVSADGRVMSRIVGAEFAATSIRKAAPKLELPDVPIYTPTMTRHVAHAEVEPGFRWSPDELANILSADGGVLTRAGVDEAVYVPPSVDSIEGFEEVLPRVIERLHTLSVSRLTVVVRGATALHHERRPAHHALLALARAHAAERPDRRTYIVAAPSTITPLDLAGALTRAPGPEQVALWNDGAWFVPSLEPATSTPQRVIARGSRVFIVGGAGGVGRALCEHIVRQYDARLVIVGRRAPGDDIEHEAWLRDLGKMCDQGSAQYIRADFSRPAQATQALEMARGRLGGIDVVIVASGHLEPGLIEDLSRPAIQRHVRAKLTVTHNTLAALGDSLGDLDGIVLLSSMSGVLPEHSAGLAIYACVNAYLDSWARDLRQLGLPARTIAYGPWLETGMSEQTGVTAALTRAGFSPLSPEHGVAGFELALGVNAATVVVGEPPPTRQPARRALATSTNMTRPEPEQPVERAEPGDEVEEPTITIAAIREDTPPVRSEEAPPERAAGAGADDIVEVHELPSTSAAPPAQTPEELYVYVRALIANALRIPPSRIDTDASFLDLGLDSLAAVSILRRIERHTGVKLPKTLLLELDSLGELIDFIQEDLESGRAQGPHDTAQIDYVGESEGASLMTSAQVQESFEEQPARDAIELNPLQRAFFANHWLHPDVPAYAYIRQTVRVMLDEHALTDALGEVYRRHAMCRAQIRGRGRDARVVFAPPEEPPTLLEVIDLERSRQDLGRVEQDLRARRYDLTTGPLWGAVLIREGARSHLVVMAHHIIMDAWSLGVVGSEIWSVYAARTSGEILSLADPGDPGSFPGEEEEQREALEAFWRAKLERVARTPALPALDEKQSTSPHTINVATSSLRASQTMRLRAAARAHRATLFELLLTDFARHLCVQADEPACAIRVAVANRDHADSAIEHTVDCLADTLPVRIEFGDRFDDVSALTATREAWHRVRDHAGVTSIDLARWSERKGAGVGALTRASFSYAALPFFDDAAPGQIEGTFASTATAVTEFGLVAWIDRGALHFSLHAPARLAATAELEQWLEQWLATLTRQELPPPNLPAYDVAGRILHRCKTSPRDVLIEQPDGEVRAAALADRVAGIGYQLMTTGMGHGDVAAILLERGADAAAAIVAVLSTGATWLGLAPEHPTERTVYMCDVADAKVVLCHAPTRARAAEVAAATGATLLDLDEIQSANANTYRATTPLSTSIAYIIFTSGSTGRPKGVPIKYSAMANYLDFAIDAFAYREHDKLAQTSSLAFDASVRQILAPLLVGATCVFVPSGHLRDLSTLTSWLVRSKVSVWSSVPTLWFELLRSLEADEQRRDELARALRIAHVGGEELRAEHARRWFELFPDTTLTNLYGPTEVTINATWHRMDAPPSPDLERVPIGAPVRGATVKVVDPTSLKPLDGVATGELVVAGVGLTPGYLGEAGDRMTDAFLLIDGVTHYRTGDLVERGEDDLFTYLGRIDDQVQIRGHRVEPSEIERVALDLSGVLAAAVLPRDGQLELHLTADRSLGDVNTLRRWLAERLPAYMIPGDVFIHEDFPMTPAGKLDRGALASRSVAPMPVTTGEGGAATSDTERTIADAFAKVLGVPGVGRADDFFELGGDSLLVMDLFAELSKSIAGLPAPTHFQHNATPAAFAALVQRASAEEHEPSFIDEEFDLSPPQRGFLFTDSPSTQGWFSSRIELRGALLDEHIVRAAQITSRRHPLTRIALPGGADATTQRVLPPDQAWELEVHDLSSLDSDQRSAAIGELSSTFAAQRPTLEQGPLVIWQAMRLSPELVLLDVSAHHIAADAYSAHRLAAEFVALLDQLAKEEQPNQMALRGNYQDAALAMSRAREDVATHNFWSTVFAHDHDPHTLRRAHDPCEPHSTMAVLDEEEAQALFAAARAQGTSAHTIFMTALARVLARWAQTEDIVLAATHLGRELDVPDIQQIFGCFAHALPIRVEVGADEPGDVTWAKVRRAWAGAREHHLMPGQIATIAKIPADLLTGSRALFSWIDMDSSALVGDVVSASFVEELARPHGSDASELFCTARVRSDASIELTLDAGRDVLAGSQLHAVLAELTAELSVFADAGNAQDEPTPRISAALVGYLPSRAAIRQLLPDFDDEMLEALREELFSRGPILVEELDTPFGSSGFVCIDLFADELPSTAAASLTDRVHAGIELARSHGARAISLAGMLPSRLGYGQRVAGDDVTTGHAATVASVLFTIASVLEQTGRDISALSVAMLGLGSIGRGVAMLLSELVGAPREIILCERPDATGVAQDVVQRLGAQQIPASISLSNPDVPEQVYGADLIIGATSSPSILDVDKLRPGTIVVDDSFPYCFDEAAAMARMTSQQDTLFVGAGLLRVEGARREVLVELLGGRLGELIASQRAAEDVASCQLESLLLARVPELPRVVGLVEAEEAEAYLRACKERGVVSARLHLGEFELPEELIAAFGEGRRRGEEG